MGPLLTDEIHTSAAADQAMIAKLQIRTCFRSLVNCTSTIDTQGGGQANSSSVFQDAVTKTGGKCLSLSMA